ncbi:hypothetical protein BJX76DRAFT_358162 [Aspergillus varians]
MDDENTGLELRNYRSLAMSASGGRYLATHDKGSPGYVNSPSINQPQEQELITVNWEMPSLLRLWSSSADGLARRDFVLGAITLVVMGNYIEPITCKEYLEGFHSERGVELVETIINALSAPEYLP